MRDEENRGLYSSVQAGGGVGGEREVYIEMEKRSQGVIITQMN